MLGYLQLIVLKLLNFELRSLVKAMVLLIYLVQKVVLLSCHSLTLVALLKDLASEELNLLVKLMHVKQHLVLLNGPLRLTIILGVLPLDKQVVVHLLKSTSAFSNFKFVGGEFGFEI